MSRPITFYDRLQVSRGADPIVIRAAYRALSQVHHPDKNPDNVAAAVDRMHLINEAYEILSDPVKRAEHDAWIEREEALWRAQEMEQVMQAFGESHPGQRFPSGDGEQHDHQAAAQQELAARQRMARQRRTAIFTRRIRIAIALCAVAYFYALIDRHILSDERRAAPRPLPVIVR